MTPSENWPEYEAPSDLHATQSVSISVQSVSISVHQWQSVAICGNQWQSVAISGDRMHSVAISPWRARCVIRQSVPIISANHQCQSSVPIILGASLRLTI
jgi:hypothetical protein